MMLDIWCLIPFLTSQVEVHQKKLCRVTLLFFFWLSLGSSLFPADGAFAAGLSDQKTINIGVLARRGPDECVHEWQPTADYLATQIPGVQFRIKPFRFEEAESIVKTEAVDFIILNSYLYVKLRNIYGISRIATLKRLTPAGYAPLFGGTIFCKSDRNDIANIEDLAGKSFMAVDQDSFGGWLAALLELKRHGIDPQRDFSSLQFGGTHDDVVYAVRDGKVEAGTIATPILDNMIAEGKVDQRAFKIIHQQHREGFPFLSTELYPEWPIAKLKHTSSDLAEKVTIALLTIFSHDPAAKAAGYAGWTVALDYTPIDECLQELRHGIYENYGKITIQQLVSEYRWQAGAFILTITSLISMLIYLRQLNKNLQKTKTKLQQESQEKDLINDQLHKTNEILHQSRQQMETIIDFLPDATFVVDNEKNVIIWNKAIEEMSGVKKEDIIGFGDYAYTIPFYGKKRKQLIDLLDGEDSEIERQYHNIGIKRDMVYAEFFASALNQGKGAFLWAIASPLYDIHGNRVGAVESIRDITDKKEAENERDQLKSQLAQSQKMEAIGTLAGGIAHDFNNILGAIIGYSDIAREQVAQDSCAYQNLTKILEAGYRAATLVKQILAFSRQIKIDPKPINLKEVIREAINIIRPSLPSTITIQQHLDNRVDLIDADATQMQQLLINLCTNAYHAMEESGGILEITLENCFIDRKDLPEHEGLVPGNYVLLSVSDTGEGIDEDIRNRIFEPFFTTKAVGKGTGMGLSIVHGIVTGNGGFIRCRNNVEKGTIFHVYLPALMNAPVIDPKNTNEALPRGSGHILFVDDEEMLVDIGRALLKQLGYTVTTQTSSRAALALFQENPDQFDAVVTDQTMPHLTGVHLAREILKVRPDIPVILCTGYSSLLTENRADAEGIWEIAMKPVSKEVLSQLLHNALKSKVIS
jgi:signal transduction histidine kinase/ABC-type phosphate/phosphonate transport system substrate-binding protein/ActR/RegA family two-component response regulator